MECREDETETEKDTREQTAREQLQGERNLLHGCVTDTRAEVVVVLASRIQLFHCLLHRSERVRRERLGAAGQEVRGLSSKTVPGSSSSGASEGDREGILKCGFALRQESNLFDLALNLVRLLHGEPAPYPPPSMTLHHPRT